MLDRTAGHGSNFSDRSIRSRGLYLEHPFVVRCRPNLGDIRAPSFVVTGLHDFKPFPNSGCPRYTVGMSRHEVTAEPWALIAPLIPKPKAGPGRQRNDDRRTLHGLFFILQIGGTGAEVPRVDGAPATCWRRFCAWSTAGLWERRWRAVRSPREAQGKLAGAQAFLAGHFVPAHNRAMGSAPRRRPGPPSEGGGRGPRPAAGPIRR